MLVDATLNWKYHISNISKKISRGIGIMYKLRPFLPLNIMKNVYYSLIYSHILYAIEVWGSACKTELDKIIVLQKRVIRMMVYKDQYNEVPGPLSSSDPIFARLQTLKVVDIYKFQTCKFIFKCLNQLTPDNFHQCYLYNHDIHTHNTRANYNSDCMALNSLFVPFARTTNYGLKQLRINGPRIWNSLPTQIRKLTSLNIFLKKLKLHLISDYS